MAVTLTLVTAGLAAPATSAERPEPLPLGPADLLTAGNGALEAMAPPKSVTHRKRQAYLLKLAVRSTSKTFAAAGEGATARRAARQQLDRVTTAQRAVIDDLPPKTPVLYTTHALLSGVAVSTDPANVSDLEAIKGVAAVYPIAPKQPSLTTSIPLQGGPTAWQNSGTGRDVSIAIIDSGIDYTHADFGGEGTRQAFEDAQAVADSSWVPTDKVVGGFDLVGDDYDPDKGTPPVPDPNPLDCQGHGTHVAGIAAGQGVTSGGAPYTGPYDESTDMSGLQIGPGMAPEADLYAFRVFGCAGPTNVVTEALDMAVDPDQNGDPSDHVDVVNMSLGSDFGSALDADSIASNAAVEAGVVVIASAGNGDDLTDVSGSPGNATKVVSVANSADGESIIDGADVLIDGMPGQFGVTRSGDFDWSSGDLTGEVVLAPDTNETACEPFDPAESAAIAGRVPLVRWTQEALECGSSDRGDNLRAAGAKGYILANSADYFDAGIAGDEDIPAVLMVKSGGDAIRNALRANQPVEVLGISRNAIIQDFPENTDTVSASSSRGIHAAGNLKPDLAAVGDTVFSAAMGTGMEGISETGTSMSAPTVAGLAALMVQAQSTWTPEQVKAAMMNTATDLTSEGNGAGYTYAPVRVGAGRIQADQAVGSEVTAAVAGEPGVVSVGFGPVEVSGPTTLSKAVAVTNHGSSPVDYEAAYDEITYVEGVSFSVSPESLTVDPGTTERVTVTFRAEGREALDNSVDPTIGRWTNLGPPRTTLAEASGRLLLTPATGPELRVPVYAAPRPASALTAGSTVSLDPATQRGRITMSGNGLGFGVNATNDEDSTNDINSIGAAFELAATDPAALECAGPGDTGCWTLPVERAADIRQVGVTVTDEMAYFAIVADKPWTTPDPLTGVEIYIDTDGDSTEDYISYITRFGSTDTFVAALLDAATDEVVDVQYLNGLPGNIDTALYDSNTVVLPVLLDALSGVDPQNPRVRYAVAGWSAYQQSPIDLVGLSPDGDMELSVNLLTPGLSVRDANGHPMYPETTGTPLQVTRDPAVYKANKPQGLLLVHFHNAVGAKSEVVAVTDAPAATTTTMGADPATVEVNKPAALKVGVTSASGTPTGQVQVVSSETGAVLASGAVTGSGQASLTYTPGVVGTVRLQARYLGDGGHQPSTSAESVLTVTAMAGPTPRPTAPTTRKQTLSATLPRRIKRSGLTLISPANARTNAGKKVATRVQGTPRAAGQTRLFTVVRGRNGKVSLRTYGHRDLRFVIVQRAAATEGFRPFHRRAVYVDGKRRR